MIKTVRGNTLENRQILTDVRFAPGDFVAKAAGAVAFNVKLFIFGMSAFGRKTQHFLSIETLHKKLAFLWGSSIFATNRA